MDSPRSSAAAVALLPDDAIIEILSRVPARSLCRFKCVSKAWRDLIADRHHREKLPQTLEGFFCAYDGEIHGGNRGEGGRVVQGRFIVTQVKIKWSGLPLQMATWEDYYVLKEKFPTAPAWGPAGTQGGGIVTVDGKT